MAVGGEQAANSKQSLLPALLREGAPREERMKKTYAAPTIVTNGDAIRETKGPASQAESNVNPGILQAPGSVGFYL